MSVQRHPITTPHFHLPIQVFVAVLVVVLAAAIVALIAQSFALSSVTSQPVEDVRAAVAQQAYIAFRRGEWFAGAPSVNAMERARIDYRRGEWFAGGRVNLAAVAEEARLDYRRGEWYAGHIPTEAELEQYRLEYRRGEWTGQ